MEEEVLERLKSSVSSDVEAEEWRIINVERARGFTSGVSSLGVLCERDCVTWGWLGAKLRRFWCAQI
ncbi:hypothetical protein Mapa_003157 [Marchantia paleacea]|nr:hypothetical protein Mapa_003157 [Marchantia paleacea]